MEGEDRSPVVVRNMPYSLPGAGTLDDAVMRSTVRTEALLRGRDMENFQKTRKNHRNTKSKSKFMEVHDEYIINFCWKKSIYGQIF